MPLYLQRVWVLEDRPCTVRMADQKRATSYDKEPEMRAMAELVPFLQNLHQRVVIESHYALSIPVAISEEFKSKQGQDAYRLIYFNEEPA